MSKQHVYQVPLQRVRGTARRVLASFSVCLLAVIVGSALPGQLSAHPFANPAAISIAAEPAPPSSPSLTLILPRGVQRGAEYELTFSGDRLQDAEEIFLYDTGVTVTGLEVIDAKNVKVKIAVDAECRLGEHVAQIRTRSGISDYRSFFIGALPTVDEVESNNSMETAQAIEMDVTVDGVITNEDVDCFVVQLKKNQRLSVEIEGIRLASTVDLFIAVLDQNRFEVAVSDDTPLLKQDGFLSVTIPEDGAYTVLVREASYRGDAQCRYRLHVGQFPRPSVVYPPGGMPGTEATLTFIGDPKSNVDKLIRIPESYGFRDGIFYKDGRGISPSPLHFRLSDLPNVLEAEPNNSFDDVLNAEAAAEQAVAVAEEATPTEEATPAAATETAMPAGETPAETPAEAPTETPVDAPTETPAEPVAEQPAAPAENPDPVTQPIHVGPYDVPCAFNGIIEQPGDIDVFSFQAVKDQVFEVECYARRIGSGLDPIIQIFNSEKAYVDGNDDAKRPDAYLRFTVPADGRYFVRVFDHLRRGQSDFVYRIEFTPVKPTLAIQIPRVDRYSQQRQTIVVPRGNRFATLINAERADFGGELKLLTEGIPAGITVTAPPMRDNLNMMPVVFEADENAEIGGTLFDLQSAKTDDSISGSFYNLADFVLGEPNNTRYYGCTIDRVAIAVVDKVPFKLEIVQPAVPMVQDGMMSLKVIVHRDEGFAGAVNVQFPFRSPGVGTQAQLAIAADQTEIDYPLNANGNAQPGKWPMFVLGQSDVGGPAWVSSQMAELEIAAPLVRITIPRTICEQALSAEVVCTFEQLTPFDGEATLEILGVPPGATIEPQKFTKDTTELKFNVTTTAETPVQLHKSLFCQITITKDGQPIVSKTGYTELQVINPKPEEIPEETKTDEAQAESQGG